MTTGKHETIVALSSGALPSGVAVIRMSGPHCAELLEASIGFVPEPRKACLSNICGSDGKLIDEGLVLWFPGPASYTGENCIEFQVHGGKAVISSLLAYLCSFSNVRLAEAGEFSRRAFENGKKDLTAIDGIADLIACETEAQRRLAVQQSQGSLRDRYEAWRKRIIYIRAMLEAEFDFSDEEDVPEEISEEGLRELSSLIEEIESYLDDNRAGEIIRDGYRIALMGKPNAGKSSLLNALAKRDLAIVTEQAGTTRDVLELHLDLAGNKVIVFDTAGLRETKDQVEIEGVKRGIAVADNSDLVVWLTAFGDVDVIGYQGSTDVLSITTKIDLTDDYVQGISAVSGEGMQEFMDLLQSQVSKRIGNPENALITRKRYRDGLETTLQHLMRTRDDDLSGLELRAEEARLAGVELGRLTGKVDVEDLLDVIFAEFCVGK